MKLHLEKKEYIRKEDGEKKEFNKIFVVLKINGQEVDVQLGLRKFDPIINEILIRQLEEEKKS